MKLTVDTLDNFVKSAIIDIGVNNGYVEVFISKGVVHLNVFNKEGDVVHDYAITTKQLRSKGAIQHPSLSQQRNTMKEKQHEPLYTMDH